MNSSVTLPIPTGLRELFTKLTLISMVETHQKINLTSMSFVSTLSWYGSFSRYYNGESRKSLLDMLNLTISETIQTINDYSKTEFCTLIVTHLAIAKRGIENLKTTYKDDPNIISQLEIILENICIQLDKNSHLVQGDDDDVISDKEITNTVIDTTLLKSILLKKTEINAPPFLSKEDNVVRKSPFKKCLNNDTTDKTAPPLKLE